MDDGKSARALAEALLCALTESEIAALEGPALHGRDLSSAELDALPALRPLSEEIAPGLWRLAPAFGPVLRAALGARRAPAAAPLASPWIAITKGAPAAEALVRDRPDHLIAEDLKLGLFKIVLALKSGDLARADALLAILSEHFEIPPLAECDARRAPELACVLFMKAVYSDEDISDEAFDQLFATLSELPKDASLMRAVLYNVALDMCLRRNEIAMAEETAQRALFHYRNAGEEGVAFYVYLYLVVIALWNSDLGAAGTRLGEARRALAIFEGATPNDGLLLRSFELILSYEARDEDGFARHLLSGEDTIPFGELWPSVAVPIISYGRRALASKITPAAALSWVRRWRVRQWRSRRFDALISVQEALALQGVGRWQEADEVLSGIEGGAGADLQIARYAAALDRAPGSAELGRQIQERLEAPALSVRQASRLRLLAAQSATLRGLEREAARHLAQAVKAASPEQLPALWSEQQALVAQIFGHRELRAELRKLPKLRRQLEALSQSRAAAKPGALTRQEFRVLQLLAESQSNKAIGLRLGVALPTVKFHVANLCRKTGAPNRRAVVRKAIEAGWLAEI